MAALASSTALLAILILAFLCEGKALSLSCTQKLLAVQPCLDKPSGSACCGPAKAANDAKCLCDPGIFRKAEDYGVSIDASNITQIARNCGILLTAVALAGTPNCPFVPGATIAPALAAAINTTAVLNGNYTMNSTTLYVITVGNTSFATNCTAANVTTSLENPLNTTLLRSLNCSAYNATTSRNLTQAFPLLNVAQAPTPTAAKGRSTCCKIPVVSNFCGWFGGGCS